MATVTVKALPIPPRTRRVYNDWQAMVSLLVCAGLPLGLFGLVNLLAEAVGQQPYFFSPFGMPGQVGAALHLAILPLVGISGWLVGQQAHAKAAQRWLALLAAAIIALPFLVTPLPSLGLSVTTMAVLFLAVGTFVRVSAVSRAAAWALAPIMLWLGLSAVLGLVFTAAWAPPFGLVQSNQPAASV